MTEFICEVKQTKSRKLISNDIEYEVTLRSPDPKLMELALVEADRLLKGRFTYAD